MDGIKRAMVNYLKESFMMPEDLDENASLLENGIIDSTGVIELVGFLEENFGIVVKDEEITPDNLDSVKKIVTYVIFKKEPILSN